MLTLTLQLTLSLVSIEVTAVSQHTVTSYYLSAVSSQHLTLSDGQITNQFHHNVSVLKMSSLHNNYRILQKSQLFCIRS